MKYLVLRLDASCRPESYKRDEIAFVQADVAIAKAMLAIGF